MNDLGAFLVGSALLVWFSRKALRHTKSHGFYRFFAGEAILAQLLLNHEPWGTQPLSPHQITAQVLQLLSLLLVTLGLLSLLRQGKAGQQRSDPALYGFEKTTALVSSGIYKYIRHPMYASLLALGWAGYFQEPSLLGTAISLFASYCLLRTAKAEEQECLAYFGAQYAEYRQRTRMFIPYVI